MLLRAIIADSRLYLRVRPNAIQITVNYSATSDTEVKTLQIKSDGPQGFKLSPDNNGVIIDVTEGQNAH